jgi:hypothetical protein
MRKLMWLLLAVALGIAPSAAEAQFPRQDKSRFGSPRVPGIPAGVDPFGRPVVSLVPGPLDPFGRAVVDQFYGPFDPFGGPAVSPFPPRPFVPRPGVGRIPGQFDPVGPWLGVDPSNPMRWPNELQGLIVRPGHPIPAPPIPAPPNLGNLPSRELVSNVQLPPELVSGRLQPALDSSASKSSPQAKANSQPSDSPWWPWVLGATGVVFVLALIVGFVCGASDPDRPTASGGASSCPS